MIEIAHSVVVTPITTTIVLWTVEVQNSSVLFSLVSGKGGGRSSRVRGDSHLGRAETVIKGRMRYCKTIVIGRGFYRSVVVVETCHQGALPRDIVGIHGGRYDDNKVEVLPILPREVNRSTEMVVIHL